ncbi:hypothetical protein FOZ63_000799, partial [Perkinsus olseni]
GCKRTIDLTDSRTPIRHDGNGLVSEIDEAIGRASATLGRLRESRQQDAALHLLKAVKRILIRPSFRHLRRSPKAREKARGPSSEGVKEALFKRSAALSMGLWIEGEIRCLQWRAFSLWRIFVCRSIIWQSQANASATTAHAQQLAGSLQHSHTSRVLDYQRLQVMQRKVSVSLGVIRLYDVAMRVHQTSECRSAFRRWKRTVEGARRIDALQGQYRLCATLGHAVRRSLATGFSKLAYFRMSSALEEELKSTIERLLAVAIPITAAVHTLNDFGVAVEPPRAPRRHRSYHDHRDTC